MTRHSNGCLVGVVALFGRGGRRMPFPDPSGGMPAAAQASTRPPTPTAMLPPWMTEPAARPEVERWSTSFGQRGPAPRRVSGPTTNPTTAAARRSSPSG